MMRALVLVLASVLWFGCGGGGGDCEGVCDGGGGGSDIGVGLTTAGGATSVTSGSTLAIRVNVTNSTTMVVTWNLTGPMCPGGCGTITPTALDFATYAAPANVATQFTVTVTATSVEDTSKSGSVTLAVLPRVCPAGASRLDGQFAFLLQGFDQASRDGIAVVGSFTSDACGVITGGTADYFLGQNVTGIAPLTGTYAVGTDERGTIRLGLGATTANFAIALGGIDRGIAHRGAITEIDPAVGGGPVLSGSLWRQDPTAFALSRITGPFAFVLNGWIGSGPRMGMGGTIAADGAGHFTGGPLDVKTTGIAPPTTTASWTGTLGTPTAAGRSVVTAPVLTGAGGSAVMYAVTSGRMLLMVSDPSGGGRVLSGQMLAQTGPFDQGSLSGRLVTHQTANYDQPGYEALTTATLSLFTADGAGGLSITSYDQAFGGNSVHGSGIRYTYTVDPTGQATIFLPGQVSGGKWYLLGPGSALMLGFDYGVSVGEIVPQTSTPFTAANVIGDYFVRQAPGAGACSSNASGVARSPGNGTLSTTMDVNQGGVWTVGQAASRTLSVATDGTAADTDGDVYYLASSSRLFMMNRSPSCPVVHLLER